MIDYTAVDFGYSNFIGRGIDKAEAQKTLAVLHGFDDFVIGVTEFFRRYNRIFDRYGNTHFFDAQIIRCRQQLIHAFNIVAPDVIVRIYCVIFTWKFVIHFLW